MSERVGGGRGVLGSRARSASNCALNKLSLGKRERHKGLLGEREKLEGNGKNSKINSVPFRKRLQQNFQTGVSLISRLLFDHSRFE